MGLERIGNLLKERKILGEMARLKDDTMGHEAMSEEALMQTIDERWEWWWENKKDVQKINTIEDFFISSNDKRMSIDSGCQKRLTLRGFKEDACTRIKKHIIELWKKKEKENPQAQEGGKRKRRRRTKKRRGKTTKKRRGRKSTKKKRKRKRKRTRRK